MDASPPGPSLRHDADQWTPLTPADVGGRGVRAPARYPAPVTPFPAALLYLVLGIALVVAIVAPRMLAKRPISSPLVLLGLGIGLGLLPFTEPLAMSEETQLAVVEHAAELTVLVSLMGAGLAIDRPLRLLDRATWRRWRPTWKMLALAMPVGIAGIALLGWVLGLAPAVALLVASALAPTDPVLASEVQVEGPNAARREASDEDSDHDERAPGAEPQDAAQHLDDEKHEVAFVLTSEAALNDGLAFPFVHAAIALAGAPVLAWLGHWAAWELAGKLVLGVAVGLALGWILGWLAFAAPVKSLRVAETGESLMALAAVFVTYGVAETVGGYGFLAVTVCALTFRSRERTAEYHEAMHEVVERLEVLLTLCMLLGLGFAIARGVLAGADWRSAVLVAALLLVGRPLPAWLALRGDTRLTPHDKAVIGFFGIRGIGSLYYTAYALSHADFGVDAWVWGTIALAITTSVVIHGIAATPALDWLERRNARHQRNIEAPTGGQLSV